MKLLHNKGTILLFVVVAMTAISVLGTGIYFMTTTATFGGLDANDQNRAYQLALAGKDYALTKGLRDDTASKFPNGFTFTNGDKFRLVISGDTITSTGIVNENTPYEARRTITVTKTGFGSQAGVSFVQDIAAMGIIKPTSAPADFISKTSSSISLGQIGGSTYGGKFGAVVYSGNAVQGNCVAGKCEFGSGFNAFFVFQFASKSTGDGFTFAFFNGNNNNSSSVGGFGGYGEYMGYAGNSYVSSGYYLDNQNGRGIQPPKVAVEFDPFQNGTNTACLSDSRYDGIRNHMALVFWGDNTTKCAFPGEEVGKYTFDDNRHGSGTTNSATDPMNAQSPLQSDACNYFDGNSLCGTGVTLPSPTWLLDAPNNVYAFRMEVTRSLTAVGGNYSYQIKTWIKPCASGDLACSAYADSSTLANTKVSYTDTDPTLNRTIQLNEAYHQAFNTLLFGWTTATSTATQNININRFRMNFLK